MTLMQMSPSESAHESGGYLKGVALAVVTDNKDPSGLARVQVRYRWQKQPSPSSWARLAMPMAGPDRGFLMIPEVGDEVLVAFEKEDLCFPYVIGVLWNGEQKPPLTNTDGKNDKRILRSRKKHHLLFDDGVKGVVELHHEKGRKIVLDDKGFMVQDENGNVIKVDSTTGAMTLQAKGQLSIKAASIKLEATGILELKGGPMLKIEGNMVTIN